MASKKAALGRGLSALLPAQPSGEDAETPFTESEAPPSKLYRFGERVRLLGRVADLEIDAISPNPYQPRKDFSDKGLEELADSIRQLGIIQPITVRFLSNGRFEVISGERRLRAARRAGLKRIPAYVREAGTEEMLEMAIVENIQREDLNPVEVALGYKRLMEECNLTQEQVATKVGKNRATVANFLRLLKLPPRILAALRDGTISVGHARALITIDDMAMQLRFLKEVRNNDLSVRDIELRVRTWHEHQTPPEQEDPPEEATLPAPPDRNALQLREITNQLRTHLSTQIQIKHKADGSGKIEIAYYAHEDLERLLELLLKK